MYVKGSSFTLIAIKVVTVLLTTKSITYIIAETRRGNLGTDQRSTIADFLKVARAHLGIRQVTVGDS